MSWFFDHSLFVHIRCSSLCQHSSPAVFQVLDFVCGFPTLHSSQPVSNAAEASNTSSPLSVYRPVKRPGLKDTQPTPLTHMYNNNYHQRHIVLVSGLDIGHFFLLGIVFLSIIHSVVNRFVVCNFCGLRQATC